MQPKTGSELAEIAKARAEELAGTDITAVLLKQQIEFAFTIPARPRQREFTWADLNPDIVRRGGRRSVAGRTELRRELRQAWPRKS